MGKKNVAAINKINRKQTNRINMFKKCKKEKRKENPATSQMPPLPTLLPNDKV